MFNKAVNSNSKNLIHEFITPLTPYLICNHFIATEICKHSKKYVNLDINVNIKANNLLKNNNYDAIKNFDIIQIQVDYFDFFYEKILPIIMKNNICIIIITSQWHLPQLHKSYKTDNCLNSDNILLWISQNPIYYNNKKYMAFPYGLLHTSLFDYIKFVKMNDNNSPKENKLINQYSSVHGHLPNNHIRKVYDIFGKNSGKPLDYNTYLKNIMTSEFVISTPGDRDDCYRHYECIGLNALPISNIKNGYMEIFEDNMVYSNPEEMVNMVSFDMINKTYKNPNRDILTLPYWSEKIIKKIYELNYGNNNNIMYNMLVTIFGSCRQDAIYKIPNVTVTGIRENVSYPHYTKEMLEVIKFCKEGHISPEETVTTFRTPIICNKPLYFNDVLKKNFNNTSVFILEIASRKTYEFNGKFVHHVLFDEAPFNQNYKDKITVSTQSDEEIEADIIQIKKELNRPIIIVGHLLTYNKGTRYELVALLEKLCLKHNILFINPENEITKLGYNVKDLLSSDSNHYNEKGHEVIQGIYTNFLVNANRRINYLRIYETEYNKFRFGSSNDGGYVIADGLSYDLLLSCGINDDVTFENCFIEKYGTPCYAFDGTINNLPNNANSNIVFIKKNIANKETNKTTNLLNYLENNDNIFLKMDIETNEYQLLEILELKHLNKLKQIVIEFHFPHQDSEYVNGIFNRLSFPIPVERRVSCFKKLDETHYLIHLHPNNCCGTTTFNGVEIPNVFECTYIKKDLCKDISYSSDKIPNPLLDSKNILTNPEICLSGYPFSVIL